LQTNKRPHDDASLELLDIKKMHNSPGHNFAPHGHTSTVWFIDASTGIMYEAKNVANIPAGNDVGIVLESLQQRHTSMAVVQDVQPGMTLNFQMIYHLEGIAD